MRTLFPIGVVLLVLLALPGAAVFAGDLLGYGPDLNAWLEARFAVDAVGDGEAALAAVHRRAPDLILSDVMMPRLDGFGLLQALRDDPGTREIPIILLSARAGEEASVEGLQHGADDYLVKPFSARELIARVETHLALVQLRAESIRREQAAREAKCLSVV